MEAASPPAQAPAALEEGRIDVQGVGGPVLQAGPREAREAIVFLHGNPGSGREFGDLLGAAGTFARAVAPDMPGFARADKPRNFRYDNVGYADHFDGLLRELGIDRVHLVLHDLGGPWGLEWASRKPAGVGSVTLLNTGVLIGYRWHILARIWRTPGLGELFQATATRPLFRLLTNRGQKRKLPREFLDHMYDVNFSRPTRRVVLKVYRNSPHPDEDGTRQAQALRPHDIPALIVWGARDPYLGVELAGVQRQAFPRARLVMLDDSGHWPYMDNPQAVAAEVIPFLREQTTASPTIGELI
jgi:pimeloyl-ACP methyl ester carboxylesterase